MCNIPLVFSEILKDEINANEEDKIFNGVKSMVRKYSEERNGIQILNEFISVLCGGATLDEILQVTKDEALDPTLFTGLTVDESCKIDEEHSNLQWTMAF